MQTGSTHISPQALATEKIGKLLFRFALPAIIATTATSLYNITNSIFVGRTIGAMAVSALGIAFPTMNLIAAFGSMVGNGASALLSIKTGEKKEHDAFLILGNVVTVNLILGVLILLIGLSFLDEILLLFGASNQTLPLAKSFMKILLYGNLVTHLYWGLNEFMRANGFPLKAMNIILFSVVTNCFLNALFLFWFQWGIKGSALAIVLSQTLALLFEIIHFCKKKNPIYFKMESFKIDFSLTKHIFTIGAAPFFIKIGVCLVAFFINNILKIYGGDLYIGAYNIVNRIMILFIMIVVGLNQGMQPIVGYNYGAKNMNRVWETLKTTIVFGTIITTIGFIVAEFFPSQIASLFVKSNISSGETNTQSLELIQITKEALRIIFIAFPFIGFQIVTSNFFQYINNPRKAIFLSLSRQIIFLIPLLMILPKIFGYKGIWIAIPIADVLSILAALVLFLSYKKNFGKLKN